MRFALVVMTLILRYGRSDVADSVYNLTLILVPYGTVINLLGCSIVCGSEPRNILDCANNTAGGGILVDMIV